MTTETSNSRHGRRWWVLALVGVAQLMVVLDATIVSIALPSAQAALHFRPIFASGWSPPMRWRSDRSCLSAGASAIALGGSGRSSAVRPGSRLPPRLAARRSPSGC
jgi:hypothetical protein